MLADRCCDNLLSILPVPVPVTGMRLPILRETRMPAVWCRLGPAAAVVIGAPGIAQALAKAVVKWCREPVKP